MPEHSDTAERIALAIISGRVSMDTAREDLRLALRQREVARDASALSAYRSGEPVWSWPAVVPWSGF